MMLRFAWLGTFLFTASFAVSCATAPHEALPVLSMNENVRQMPLVPSKSEFERAPASPESLAKFAAWSSVTAPTSGPTELIGSYASGCIKGAQALPLQSKNYVVMRPSRLAYFGDPSLVKFVTQLADQAATAGLPPILVEDLSHPRGGPVAKGHGSHQIGLDVDVSLTPAWPTMTEDQHESFIAPSFVIDRKVLKPEWSATQAKLLALAASFSNVNRIFVSPAIKTYFCEKFLGEPWLYKLRPWWGHDDHMHVRLNCPANSKTCRKQTPLNPKDDPCGPDLKWWFSAAADQQAKDMANFWVTGQTKEFPVLPKECEAVRKQIAR